MTQQSSVLHFPAISQWVADCREIKSRLDETEATQIAAVKLERVSREQAQAARIELGTYLLRVRAAYPKRGTREHGWKQFLEAIEVDDSTACRYMHIAGGLTASPRSHETQDPLAGLELDVEPRTDDEIPADVIEAMLAAEEVEQLRAEVATVREVVGSRDSWCTPGWLARALPALDVDPCSNPYASVKAETVYMAEAGQDGLTLPWFGVLFCNPPYGKPLPWAQKLDADRATITACGFLMNTAGDTEWWQLLAKHLPLRLDFNDRIEFTPPPGIKPSRNDRPQTLLMDAAFWKACDQKALLAVGTLWERR